MTLVDISFADRIISIRAVPLDIVPSPWAQTQAHFIHFVQASTVVGSVLFKRGVFCGLIV